MNCETRTLDLSLFQMIRLTNYLVSDTYTRRNILQLLNPQQSMLIGKVDTDLMELTERVASLITLVPRAICSNNTYTITISKAFDMMSNIDNARSIISALLRIGAFWQKDVNDWIKESQSNKIQVFESLRSDIKHFTEELNAIYMLLNGYLKTIMAIGRTSYDPFSSYE